MNISIDRISIRNFKGIKALDVNFGNATAIYGENATGKTTIFDAFLWALFGKDSQNSATFAIKPLNGNGQAAHNLDHAVDVALNVDGRPMLLSKVFTEKYTKKRGSAKAEFTGHTTDYFIDGVPIQEKEYKERIKAMINENVFRLLTDPRYFNEVLHWQDRRKILMEICGEVEIADVIASDKGLSGLTSILNGHSIDDFRKMIAAQKREINDQLEKIPVRIDEASRSIVEIRPDIDTVPAQIDALEAKKRELESQLADLRNGGTLSAKRIELQEIEAEILQQKNTFEKDRRLLIESLQKECDDILEVKRSLASRAVDLSATIDSRTRELAGYEEQCENLRHEWIAIDSQESTDPTMCPTCKQPMPQRIIEEARKNFLNAKASRLASIEQNGIRLKHMIESLQDAIKGFQEELSTIPAATNNLDARYNDIMKRISDIQAEHPDFPDLEAKKASIQAEIDNVAQAEQGVINEVRARMEQTISEIRELEAELQKAEANKRAESRIEELQRQEKVLAEAYEAIEKNLCLIEDFTRAKVKLVSEKINSKFSLARFRLFEDQINGGLSEVCETTLNGVPYSSMNNAGRVQVGLDIIRTLQAHYGIIAPVFVDNAEAIVEIPPMSNQVIKLIVSANDKQLRIETSESKKAA